MGKRELLIVLAFVVAGFLAYQVSNPDPMNRRPGFSFSSFLASIRREARGNRSTASVVTTSNIPLPEGVSELRLSGFPRVSVTGGPGREVSYELVVESNGPDEGTARQNATGTKLTQDVVGPVLSLRPTAPRNVRSVARLSLTVPARLLLRVTGAQGGSRLEVADVAGVHLDAVVGDVRLTRIKSAVTGSHRNGAIDVSESGELNLTVVSSRVTVENMRGDVTLNARNGPSRLAGVRGPITVDASNGELTIVEPQNTVRVSGTGGKVKIDNPQKQVNVDVRRTEVTVTLNRSAPLTVITAEAPIHLILDGLPSIALDAVTVDGGAIDAKDFLLTPETASDETRLRHVFGDGAAPVALRNQRATIVIGRTK